ncbi:DUF4349 domain-containing protein [Amycolatopsis sp.]|uniref:DUF4349 domain-containing protein n=1 Tax=Amycolatopsis sp. TaxID=37632 RepID=UPI002B47AD6E|nr:DUF4349 domain-containing protein [Amycolatopsis sp.]
MPALLTGAALLALAGACTGVSPSSGTDMRAPTPAAPGLSQSGPQADSQGSQGKAEAAVPLAPQSRQLARTAQLTLTAANVTAAADQARQIASTAGGYSGSEHTDRTLASLTVMVPSDRLDNVITRLSALGHVTNTQQTAQDVTDQVVDVNARLANARESVDRIRTLLGRATSIADITSIESQLTTRESDLESLEARQDALSAQVAMSPLALTITPTPAAAPDPESGFLVGLASGWHAFQAFGKTLLNFLGAILPFVAILGIPFTALLYAYRRWSKRHVRSSS